MHSCRYLLQASDDVNIDLGLQRDINDMIQFLRGIDFPHRTLNDTARRLAGLFMKSIFYISEIALFKGEKKTRDFISLLQNIIDALFFLRTPPL